MRITHLTFTAMAGVAALVAACAGEPASPQAPVPAPVAPAIAPVPIALPAPPPEPEVEVDPELLGTFRMTRYYVAQESDYRRPAPAVAAAAEAAPSDADGEVVLASAAAAPAPVAGVTIYDDRGCRAIATLAPRFYEVLDVQGTGKLRDGRVVNVSEPCRCGTSPCYRVMPSSEPWGRGATSRPLQPFRTIAVDPRVIPLGSLVYIAELDGITMPGHAPWGGFVHDGCVIALDVGGGIKGMEIDFFVGRFGFKKVLDAQRRMKKVTAYDGTRRCQVKGPHVARRAGI